MTIIKSNFFSSSVFEPKIYNKPLPVSKESLCRGNFQRTRSQWCPQPVWLEGRWWSQARQPEKGWLWSSWSPSSCDGSSTLPHTLIWKEKGIVIIMDWLLVFSQNSCVYLLTLIVMVLGGGPLGGDYIISVEPSWMGFLSLSLTTCKDYL